jgi:hypothetical protein
MLIDHLGIDLRNLLTYGPQLHASLEYQEAASLPWVFRLPSPIFHHRLKIKTIASSVKADLATSEL